MIILGSTGSIGQNTLFLADKFNIKINALACKQNYKLLNSQICKFKPEFVYIKDANLAKFVEHKSVFSGEIEPFLKACFEKFGKTKLINAFVGFDGLKPSLLSQKFGFELCLANKESLVAGGKFLDCKKIIPIDSEHFGLKFLLKNSPKISQMTITASGGAIYGLPKDANLSVETILNHPNWQMGKKITTDSATMVNKLFEVLEAYWLYETKNISALIEATSQIHAIIDFEDGSSTAHFSAPDMKLAIAHALNLEDQKIIPNIKFGSKSFKFEPIDLEKYPIFGLKDAVLQNPNLGSVINSANDTAVEMFLNQICKFNDISKIIFKTIDKFGSEKIDSFEDIFELDLKIKDFINASNKGF